MTEGEVHNSPSFGSLAAATELEMHGYLTGFVNETSSLTNREKLAQIGLEQTVLGIPADGPSFDKIRSVFSEEPFDNWSSSKTPVQWLEFTNVQSPVSIIASVPDLTLFFMFYAQPRDMVQNAASQELQNRGWKYANGKWTQDKKGSTKVFDIENWTIETILKN